MLKDVVDSLLCEVFKLRLAVLQKTLSVKWQAVLLRASPTGGNSQTSILQKVKLTGIVPSDFKTSEIYKAGCKWPSIQVLLVLSWSKLFAAGVAMWWHTICDLGKPAFRSPFSWCLETCISGGSPSSVCFVCP